MVDLRDDRMVNHTAHFSFLAIVTSFDTSRQCPRSFRAIDNASLLGGIVAIRSAPFILFTDTVHELCTKFPSMGSSVSFCDFLRSISISVATATNHVPCVFTAR